MPVAGIISAVAPTLFGNWIPALFMPHFRSIGGIIAQVTIEESGTDDLTITEHPVEQGAPIADHAFKRPSTINIRAGWSMRGAYDLSAESGIYGLLLSWQASLTPFDVITGKRRYTNMLMERLTVTTDQHSEYALMADIVCRQVIIVKTASTTVDSASSSPGDQKDAASTSSSSDGGDQPTTDQGSGSDNKQTMVDNPYPNAGAGQGRPPEGGDDTGLSGTPSPQAPGGPGGSAESEVTPGGQKIEMTGAANTTVDGRNEKGFTDAGTTITSSSSSSAATMSFQRQLWQRTLKYQRDRGVHSASGFRFSAPSTR
jgi:hypothetical protein